MKQLFSNLKYFVTYRSSCILAVMLLSIMCRGWAFPTNGEDTTATPSFLLEPQLFTQSILRGGGDVGLVQYPSFVPSTVDIHLLAVEVDVYSATNCGGTATLTNTLGSADVNAVYSNGVQYTFSDALDYNAAYNENSTNALNAFSLPYTASTKIQYSFKNTTGGGTAIASTCYNDVLYAPSRSSSPCTGVVCNFGASYPPTNLTP